MFEPNVDYENALRFSRLNSEDALSTCSAHPFVLEDYTWATAEHYYQASKFVGTAFGLEIAAAPTPQEAHRLGNKWFKRKRADFQKVRVLLMTRALYSKTRQNPEIQAYLLSTGEQLLAETSQFDHFWGIARDQRGHNHLGKIWMNIRRKLRSGEAGEMETKAAL